MVCGCKITLFFRNFAICDGEITPSRHKKRINSFVLLSTFRNFAPMKTRHIQYQTSGTCSQIIDVTADENNIIQQVFFLGGCNGNLQGISQLVRGQNIDDVIKRLDGIRCGVKRTSCPDQLCRALEQLKSAPLSD